MVEAEFCEDWLCCPAAMINHYFEIVPNEGRLINIFNNKI